MLQDDRLEGPPGREMTWIVAEKFNVIGPVAKLNGSDWARTSDKFHVKTSILSDVEEYYIRCEVEGFEILKDTVEIDEKRRGGEPVLKGTSFPVSNLIAELAETSGPAELSRRFRLKVDLITDFLNGLALIMTKSRT